MSKLYELTKQIHNILPKVEEKYRVKIKVNNENWWLETWDDTGGIFIGDIDTEESRRLCPAIESNQIRQILVALENKLQNSMSDKARRFGPKSRQKVIAYLHDPEYPLPEKIKKYCIEYLLCKKQPTSLELCNRWLDGLTPLFDREPETVLTELLEILENLIK